MIDKKRNEKGFTLVELLIVVAIIALLASVALPKFARMIEMSREARTKENFRALKSAIAIYFSDNNGSWPETLDPNLGRFIPDYIEEMPPVRVTGNNKKNPGGSVSPEGKVLTVGPLVANEMIGNITGKGWRYDPGNGRIWVNSALLDTKGDPYYTLGLEGNWYE